MTRKMKRYATGLLIFTALTSVFGCSSAGPFVTNISSDGKGNIVVEKNMVKYNWYTSTITTGDNPTTMVIQVVPEEVLENAKD